MSDSLIKLTEFSLVGGPIDLPDPAYSFDDNWKSEIYTPIEIADAILAGWCMTPSQTGVLGLDVGNLEITTSSSTSPIARSTPTMKYGPELRHIGAVPNLKRIAQCRNF